MPYILVNIKRKAVCMPPLMSIQLQVHSLAFRHACMLGQNAALR